MWIIENGVKVFFPILLRKMDWFVGETKEQLRQLVDSVDSFRVMEPMHVLRHSRRRG